MGEAYAFYRSCTSTQRASYPLLVEQLSKRFTPVQIQSVQSSLFHDRKQRQGETVDTFAQELRSLFRKAYPPAQRGSEEAETMGRAVLANQFLAGLHPELKGKLAGQEGTFDQLLARARFEEAKLRDFGGDSGRRSGVRSYVGESDRQSSPRSFAQGSYPSSQDRGQRVVHSQTGTPAAVGRAGDGPPSTGTSGRTGQVRCYTCGALGHVRRNCPDRTLAGPKEAKGRAQGQSQVATIVPKGVSDPAAKGTTVKVADPVDEAISNVLVTMHGISGGSGQQQLGPTIWTEVQFEGSPVKALVDTGSPATIVGLKFALKVLATKRQPGQSPQEWATYVQSRMQQPTVTLQNYSGGTLNVVRQMIVQLSKGDKHPQALVYIHEGAPVDLLLGTDVLPLLGFSL